MRQITISEFERMIAEEISFYEEEFENFFHLMPDIIAGRLFLEQDEEGIKIIGDYEKKE